MVQTLHETSVVNDRDILRVNVEFVLQDGVKVSDLEPTANIRALLKHITNSQLDYLQYVEMKKRGTNA